MKVVIIDDNGNPVIGEGQEVNLFEMARHAGYINKEEFRYCFVGSSTVAAIFGVSAVAVNNQVKAGEIIPDPYQSKPGKYMFSMADVLNMKFRGRNKKAIR